jgi:hypothetical protein
MSIIYRTDGPWGVGKGSNLTGAEADGNFYDHDGRIAGLETSRPQPDNFANVTVAGTQITFTLVSGATLGPLDLPVLRWRWRGDWVPFTGFAANDTFRVAGDGVYMVLLDHVSAATFDRAAIAVGVIVSAGALVAGTQYTILTVGASDFTLVGASSNTVGVVFTATGPEGGGGTATTNLPLYYQLFGLGVDLFAAGVATFLGAPSSANLAAAVTDETGSGELVFSASPTFTGTPMAPTAAPGTNTDQLATTAYADAAVAAISVAFPLLSKTSNYNVTAGDSGTHFDNIGAAGEVDFTLPVAARDLKYAFLVDAAQIVKIIAQAGEKIAHADSNSATGGNVQAATPNYMIAIECHKAGQWVVSAATGAWTIT